VRKLAALFLVVFSLGCLSGRLPSQPNDREWNLLVADYQWLERLRTPGQPTGSRRQQIETLLDIQKRIEPTHIAFLEKLKEYYERTGDVRAASLYANEQIRLGDSYLYILARYDRAIAMYQTALAMDPQNTAAQQRLELAQSRRFVALNSFSQVHAGMSEDQVRRLLGMPREDWIKQVVQKGRVYSVWIYPKRDGGASAIYFDNGFVYHTNWNAAAPKTSG
jgi:tetratricopeptide (TPR) repeat protein